MLWPLSALHAHPHCHVGFCDILHLCNRFYTGIPDLIIYVHIKGSEVAVPVLVDFPWDGANNCRMYEVGHWWCAGHVGGAGRAH